MTDLFFHRIVTDSKKTNEWQHPYFLRNDAAQLCLIKRTAVKIRKSRKNPAPTDQIEKNRDDENTVPKHPFYSTSMGGLAGLGSTEHTNLQAFMVKPIPDMNIFPLGYANSSWYMPFDPVATTFYPESIRNFFKNDSSVVSLQEHTTQYNGGFTFDSPALRENASDEAPCQGLKHTTTSLMEDTTDNTCMISEGFGLGDDHYVVSELEEDSSHLSTGKFNSEIENDKQVTEISDINEHVKSDEDVSDIDFDAFMLKYFPSS